MIVERIRKKYMAVRDDLDERGRRRWAAAEARDLGWGGVTAVSLATGMSDRTVRTGIQELESPDVLDSSRQRKPGAGRRSLESTSPGLVRALEQIVDSAARGDPMSPLRWSVPFRQRCKKFSPAGQAGGFSGARSAES